MHFAVLTWLFAVASALIFELEATTAGNTRCIRDFVGTETLVVLNAKTNGRVGDGQRLGMRVTDSKGNQLAYRDSVNEKAYQTFAPTQGTSFDVCFTNTLEQSTGSAGRRYREIDLELQIGAAARDWAAIQASEKLKPAELKLQQINERVEELVENFKYMTRREERMRNTNESTNGRVKRFFLLVTLSFLGLGAWQIVYLRAYFRSKHIL